MTHDLALSLALALARGNYQRAILTGDQRLSGADLRGRARAYSGRYARSRRALLCRLTAAGIPWHVAVGAHRKHSLVLGDEGGAR